MLLILTASSAPNFILIGPGLVWHTLPARWVDTFESHYSLKIRPPAECISAVLLAWNVLDCGIVQTQLIAPSGLSPAEYGLAGCCLDSSLYHLEV